MAFVATGNSATYGPFGYWQGQRVNRRTHDAILKAAELAVWGSVRISQGGLNNTVAASAATHGGLDVVDIMIDGRSQWQVFRFATYLMECGAVPFIRGYVDTMPKHLHVVMVAASKAHQTCRAQIYNTRYGYKYGGAGLGGAPYARWWGPPRKRLTTWASSKHNPANANKPVVSLSALVWGMKNGKNPGKRGFGDNDGQQLQRALRRKGYNIVVDGVLGPQTKSAYAAWQARLFGVRKWSRDADGIPAPKSLKALGFKLRK